MEISDLDAAKWEKFPTQYIISRIKKFRHTEINTVDGLVKYYFAELQNLKNIDYIIEDVDDNLDIYMNLWLIEGKLLDNELIFEADKKLEDAIFETLNLPKK